VTLEARRGWARAATAITGLAGAGLPRGVDLSKAIDFGQSAGAVPRTNGQFDPFTCATTKVSRRSTFPSRGGDNRLVAQLNSSGGSQTSATASGRCGGWPMAGRWPGSSPNRAGAATATTSSAERVSPAATKASTARALCGAAHRGAQHAAPARLANLDMRLSRTFRWRGAAPARHAEAFNLTNRLNYSGITQRAFLVGTAGTGTAPAGVTPLVSRMRQPWPPRG